MPHYTGIDTKTADAYRAAAQMPTGNRLNDRSAPVHPRAGVV